MGFVRLCREAQAIKETAVEIERIARRAAHNTHASGGPTGLGVSSVLVTDELPPRTFLRFGAGAHADAPAWAHGMETRATPLASSTGVPASLLTIDPLALIAVR